MGRDDKVPLLIVRVCWNRPPSRITRFRVRFHVSAWRGQPHGRIFEPGGHCPGRSSGTLSLGAPLPPPPIRALPSARYPPAERGAKRFTDSAHRHSL